MALLRISCSSQCHFTTTRQALNDLSQFRQTIVLSNGQSTYTNILFTIMIPRNEVFQAIPFHASYDANEALITAGDAEEEEDHQLQEQAFSRCKLSALLLGLLVGFFTPLSIMGTNLLVITLWGEDLITKSKNNIAVLGLVWSFFTTAMAIASLRFLRNLVTITYSAIGGRSKDMPEEMVWRMECRFFVGACLAWTTTGAIFGMRAQTEYSLVMLVVALFWCKIVVMCFATDSKPSSSRKSSADEIMTVV
jgi:hypothetical protein